MAAQMEGRVRISPTLAPLLLDTLGLEGSLQWYARRLERLTGVRCEFTLHDAAGVDLPEVWAATILEIYDETLSNAARHPGASRVAVALTITAHEVTLVMRDDGRGPGTTFRLGLASS